MIQQFNIYQLKLSLKGISPTIWRRIQVPADLFLHDLHKVIQTAMGWENTHLHEFKKNGRTFGFADNDQYEGNKFMDYTSIRLVDILTKKGDYMFYVYDFGDYWEHEVMLEEILEPQENLYYPNCTDGERNCPPEDCGGTAGYNELLRIFNHPGHPDRESLVDWLDETWEPEEFDIDLINDLLMEDDFGCIPMIT